MSRSHSRASIPPVERKEAELECPVADIDGNVRDQSGTSSEQSSKKTSIPESPGSHGSISEAAHSGAEMNRATGDIMAAPLGKDFLHLHGEMNRVKGLKTDLVCLASTLNEVVSADDTITPSNPTAPLKTESFKASAPPVEAPPKKSKYNGKAGKGVLQPAEADKPKWLRATHPDLQLENMMFKGQLAEPPSSFREGISSETGELRRELIKMFFPMAFGGPKFSGKKSGKKGGKIKIRYFLMQFSHAQDYIQLTETEFVSLLCQSMTGRALVVMLNYQDLHKRGLMTVGDIYFALANKFYHGLSPALAEKKLEKYNEHNHMFNSLAQAHFELYNLAHIASLASRTRSSQTALCDIYFLKAFIKIIPSGFRAIARNAIEMQGNIRGRDLKHHEVLASLNNMRSSINDELRRIKEIKENANGVVYVR